MRAKRLGECRVFEFGCLAPISNEDIMAEQIQKRNLLWNKLVEIERIYREMVRTLLNIPDFIIDQYIQEVSKIRREISFRRRLAGNETIDVSDLQANIKVLLAEIEARKQEMAAQKKDLIEQHKTALQSLDKDRIEQVRAAQAASGLYWCNYDEVIAAYRVARIRVMREGKELKIHRTDGEGKVSVRFQRGLPVEKIFGNDTRLQIDPIAEAAWLSPLRSERRKLSRTNVRLRIGSKGHTPIWLELPMVMHRSLPKDGIIRGASVVRRKINGKYHYKLTITVASSTIARRGKATEGAIGMDVGWRRVKEGLRVVCWCDDRGRAGQLVLPDKVISQFAKVNDLRSIRYKQYNDVKARLSNWLRDTEASEWLREKAENIAAWRSPAELTGLIKEWRNRCCSDDAEILNYLEEWLRRDIHLESWEVNLRDQLQRRRREIYRIFAARIAERYSYVFMEKLNLRKIGRRIKPEESAGRGFTAGYQRTMASVNVLLQTIESTCRREGLAVQYVESSGSTIECHACGHAEKFDSAKQVEHICANCGIAYDQDYNAAKVILHRGLQRQKNAGGKVDCR